jgi:hypothetical protein
MIIFIIYARCISMKVSLLWVNHFFMQNEKEMLISICLPQSTHHKGFQHSKLLQGCPKNCPWSIFQMNGGQA